MGLQVEENIRIAVDSLLHRDIERANRVFQQEEIINRMEMDIDEKGHNLLALHHPVAVDLRRLTMILKINPDLERMGDHAVNIAGRSIRIIKGRVGTADPVVRDMAEASQRMLKKSLEAYINEDEKLAREVLGSDDIVDGYYDEIGFRMRELMENDPSHVSFGVMMTMVAYDLERIGDLASNIAEDVVYIAKGKEVRHHAADFENL